MQIFFLISLCYQHNIEYLHKDGNSTFPFAYHGLFQLGCKKAQKKKVLLNLIHAKYNNILTVYDSVWFFFHYLTAISFLWSSSLKRHITWLVFKISEVIWNNGINTGPNKDLFYILKELILKEG